MFCPHINPHFFMSILILFPPPILSPTIPHYPSPKYLKRTAAYFFSSRQATSFALNHSTLLKCLTESGEGCSWRCFWCNFSNFLSFHLSFSHKLLSIISGKHSLFLIIITKQKPKSLKLTSFKQVSVWIGAIQQVIKLAKPLWIIVWRSKSSGMSRRIKWQIITIV